MRLTIFIFVFFNSALASAQTLIHAHNDYEKPEPLFNAIRNRVYSIEADVFLINDKLYVAHTLNEIDSQKTLESLYINPIIKLFDQNNGEVSTTHGYSFSLVIDIKNRGPETIIKLNKDLISLSKYFDRLTNPFAVQIVVSGDRGAIGQWRNALSFIFFDGRPYEKYDEIALAKIAMVSDNSNKYATSNQPDVDRIKAVVSQVHKWRKPFRLWGTPDNEQSWKLLKDAGVNIINTDKVDECHKWASNQ